MSLSNMRSNSTHQYSTNKSRHSRLKKRYERFATQASPVVNLQPFKKNVVIVGHNKNKSNVSSKLTGKQIESVNQENNNLKRFINDLQQQLSVQKGRLEMNKKKTNRFTRQLNRQFQKQLYYSGKNPNAYMISGVKQQYEKIKQLYQQKCSQIDQLYRSISATNLQEMQIYTQTLQQDNRFLRQQIQSSNSNVLKEARSKKSQSKYKKGKIYKSKDTSQVQKSSAQGNKQQSAIKTSELINQDHMQVLSKQLQEQRFNLATAHKLLQRYSQRCKMNQKLINELQNKVSFLQKLMIQKDNNQHKARKQLYSLQKQTIFLRKRLSKIDQQYQDKQKSLEQSIAIIKLQQQRRFQDQKHIFTVTIEQKDQVIATMEKQIRYLSALLSYWKPLDEIAQQNAGQGNDLLKLRDMLHQNQSRLYQDRDSSKFKMRQKSYKGSSATQQHLAIGMDMGASIITDNQKSMKSNRQKQQQLMKKPRESRSQSQQNVIFNTKERAPHTCSNKHNEFSKKFRKIQLSQIKQIGNYIRYKMVGSKISIQEVKQLFNYKPSQQNQQEQQSLPDYISMKEIKTVLLQTPFNLPQAQAIKVSRYVVEDSPTEFVYVDENNQIDRTIAKSIIKAFIGQYQLIDQQIMKQQWQQTIKQYGSNLQSVFETIAPKGYIQLSKFQEILQGLGVELRDQVEDWVVGQMAVGSPNLNKLDYRLLISI